MSLIRNWSTTAANNNSSPPYGWPEGQLPSTVNDCARQEMATHRTQWEDGEWFDWGDTPSRASATTFKIAADVTSRYVANRRIKMYDGSTFYGTVASSSYSAPDTTVTVTMDSGSLTSSLSSVALGILSPTNISIPAYSPTFTNVTIGGTTSMSGAAVCKTTLNVEGATTLSGAATLKGTTTLESAAVFKTTATVEGETTLSASVTCKTTLKLDSANLMRKGSDIASAGTTDLSAATGEFVDVTGTTTITALGTATAGVRRIVRFTGALTLTHNATSLILPSTANITTAANDTATFISLGSGNWICTEYQKASGASVAGSTVTGQVIQVVQTNITATTTSTSTSLADISGVTVDITPSSSSNKVLVIVNLSVASDSANNVNISLDRAGSTIGAGVGVGSRFAIGKQSYVNDSATMQNLTMVYLDSPSTTSATTYKARWLCNTAGTNYLNRSRTDTDSGTFARGSSTITVMEIKG